MSSKPFCLGSALLILICASCSSTSDIIARSNALAAQHDYYQAYWVVADAREAQDSYTANPELEKVFWQRRLDYLIDRGRELVFEEQEQEAIQEFHRALGLDPGNKVALHWIGKARRKLADQAARRAETLRLQGDLHAALEMFQKATGHVPEFPAAMEGIARVNAEFQSRAEAAEEQYTLGIRTGEEDRLTEGFYHFSEAERMDPTLSKAKRRRAVAAQQLAAQRIERAEQMEGKGYYAAALMQYRLVKDSVEVGQKVLDRIAALEKEVEAAESIREAEMALRRGEFDEADATLKKAFEATTMERAKVSGLMLEARRRRYEHAYRAARDLELEGRLSEALAGFQAVAKAWPDGLLDEKARVSSLQALIQEAEAATKRGEVAEKAGETAKAIDAYKEARIYYPGYKDLEARIERLSRK